MSPGLYTANIENTAAYIIVPGSYKKQKNFKWVVYHSGGGEWGCVITHMWNEKTAIIRRLLKEGFIVCSISVGPEHWGKPGTYKCYKALYEYVRKNFTVDKKACLLAQSMGGLTALPWAEKNPEKVKCIYGIYPLFDLECIMRMDGQLKEKAAKAWELSVGELALTAKKRNPVKMIEALAKRRIPIMQRHGLIDKVVLYKQNAADFVQNYRKLGGKARLITVKGYGHETYPGFFNPGEIAGFFLSC